MRLRRKISVARRYLSVILACALVLAGILGMEAHARHASGVHQHNHTRGDVSDLASEHATSDDRHIGQHGSDPATPYCGDCLDFVCHGGLAVLPTVHDLPLAPPATVLAALTEFALSGRCPAPLDRPPSTLRS